MKRQEFLLNLTLATVIGALGFSLYDSHRNPPEMPVPIEADEAEEDASASGKSETTYNAVDAAKKYPVLGTKDLFVAILTPTPAPPTPTPKPTETPNINTSTAKWAVLAIQDGMVTIEDVDMTAKGIDNNVWDMKAGDTREVDTGKGAMKKLTLKAVDEVTDPDAPTATFGLDGTDAVRVVQMGNDVNAPPPPPAPAPGPPPGQAVPK